MELWNTDGRGEGARGRYLPGKAASFNLRLARPRSFLGQMVLSLHVASILDPREQMELGNLSRGGV